MTRTIMMSVTLIFLLCGLKLTNAPAQDLEMSSVQKSEAFRQKLELNLKSKFNECITVTSKFSDLPAKTRNASTKAVEMRPMERLYLTVGRGCITKADISVVLQTQKFGKECMGDTKINDEILEPKVPSKDCALATYLTDSKMEELVEALSKLW